MSDNGFCCDCPDHEACATGWPCWKVKEVADHAASRGRAASGGSLPIHRTEAGWPRCATCDGGGCLDCTDPA